jgi:diacylglycerol kinase
MRIHFIVAAGIVLLGILLGIDLLRWVSLFLAIGLVISFELINTAVEKLTDMVTSEYSEQAKKVKDISAASVLISSIISVLVGLAVFYSPLLELLK